MPNKKQSTSEKPDVAELGTPTVVVRDEAGSLSYYPESGLIRAESDSADFTIPEELFGAFITALQQDARAVSEGLTLPTDEPRIDLPASEVTIDPPAR